MAVTEKPIGLSSLTTGVATIQMGESHLIAERDGRTYSFSAYKRAALEVPLGATFVYIVQTEKTHPEEQQKSFYIKAERIEKSRIMRRDTPQRYNVRMYQIRGPSDVLNAQGKAKLDAPVGAPLLFDNVITHTDQHPADHLIKIVDEHITMGNFLRQRNTNAVKV